MPEWEIRDDLFPLCCEVDMSPVIKAWTFLDKI